MCCYLDEKYDLCLLDTKEYCQMQISFRHCQSDFESVYSLCEKCKFNVGNWICNECLREILPFHCWQLGPYQTCEFCIAVRYLFNYRVLKVCV